MSVSTSLRARGGLFAVSAGALLWGTTGVAVAIISQRSGLSAIAIGWYRVVVAAGVAALGAIVFAGFGLRRHAPGG